MPNPVISAATLTAGLRAEFANTYKRENTAMKERLGKVMRMDIPSDKLTEIYGYYESAPYPKRWIRGENISSKNFRSRQFTVTNYDWARAVEWHVNDRNDDQTKSLYDQAKDCGANWATLDERIFFQMLTSGTDLELLPTIPNAPDGAALFAANRFGLVAGNIVTGSGVATVADITTDLYAAVAAFLQFQDTEAQPLWPQDIVDKGLTIMFNAANVEIFQRSFLGSIVQATNAGISNIILNAGLKVSLWPTQRITDNDWFVFLDGTEKKPIFSQARQPIAEHVATMETSDSARATKIESIQWDSRSGYGVALPTAAIQVNN